MTHEGAAVCIERLRLDVACGEAYLQKAAVGGAEQHGVADDAGRTFVQRLFALGGGVVVFGFQTAVFIHNGVLYAEEEAGHLLAAVAGGQFPQRHLFGF